MIDPNLLKLFNDEPQLVSPHFFSDIEPSRKARVETYLSDMNAFDQETANSMAHDISRPTTPLAPTVALIPVAAHQEARNVHRTLGLYARQGTTEPFSVVLFPNAPLEASSKDVDDTMDEIKRAVSDFPELDLRWYTPEYHDNDAIGGIRRRLWNAALLLAYTEGSFDSDERTEVYGLNHDIDTISMSPRYIARVQKYRDNRIRRLRKHGFNYTTDVPVVGTNLTHAYDDQNPNGSAVAFWHDYAVRQVEGGSYEASLAVPLTTYARRGGFKMGARTYETSVLTPNGVHSRIPGTRMTTSPRRFIERLHDNGLREIWSKGSFGADDVCRGEVTDISPERKEEVIFDSLESGEMFYIFNDAFRSASNLRDMFGKQSTKESIESALAAELLRRKRMAVEVLDRFVQAPLSASIVETAFKPEHLAAGYCSELFSEDSEQLTV